MKSTRPSATNTPDWRRRKRKKQARAAKLAELARKAKRKVDLFPKGESDE